MRAVITGASGFLGGRLAQILAEQGSDVTVLARGSSDLRHLSAVRHKFVLGDLTDLPSVQSAVNGATHVFHCAACSTDWAPEKTYFEANVTGTRNVVTASRQVPSLERLVHVSTTDVYGYPEVPCTEDGPLVETSLPYNRTKLLGEQAVWSAIRSAQLPATIVRPGTIYGPRGKDFIVDIAALLRQRLMLTIDGGAAPGGFTYVDNTVRGMLSAAVSPEAVGQAYNLVDGTGTTWHQYLTRLAEQLGSKPPWLDLSFGNGLKLAGLMEGLQRKLGLRGKPLLTRHAVHLLGRSQEFPIAKAETHFAYRAGVSLEEGLQRSVDWLHAESATKHSWVGR